MGERDGEGRRDGTGEAGRSWRVRTGPLAPTCSAGRVQRGMWEAVISLWGVLFKFTWWLGGALEVWDGAVLDLTLVAPRNTGCLGRVQPPPGGWSASPKSKCPLSHRAARDRRRGGGPFPSVLLAGPSTQGHVPSICEGGQCQW